MNAIPSQWAELTLRGLKLFQSRAFRSAAEVFWQAASLNPHEPIVWLNLVATLVAGKQWKELKQAVKEAVAAGHAGFELLTYLPQVLAFPNRQKLGITFAQKDIPEDARLVDQLTSFLKLLLSLNPSLQSFSLWHQHGEAHQVIDQITELLCDKAEELLDEGLIDEGKRIAADLRSILPEHPRVWAVWCQYLSLAESVEEALAECHRAWESNPDNLDLILVAAEIYRRIGRFHEAADFQRRALRIVPHTGTGWGVLANDLCEAGEYDAAIEAAHEGLKYSPNDAHIWATLGFSFLGKKNYNQAVKCFRRALSSDPNHPEFYIFLGGALMQVGRLKEAREVLESGLQKWPGHEGLQQLHFDLKET